MRSIHDKTIEQLLMCYPGSAHNGFMGAVKLVAHKLDMEEPDSIPRILPDLWLIDAECMSIVCIEVEDSHPISADKLRKYDALWWYFDAHYWEVHLITADRWGNLTPVSIPDYGLLGQVDETRPELGNSITAEREKNRTVFELTKAYSIKDAAERAAARDRWMKENPSFLLANFGLNHGRDVPADPSTH